MKVFSSKGSWKNRNLILRLLRAQISNFYLNESFFQKNLLENRNLVLRVLRAQS
jgi:hypothetical protein